MAALKKSTYRRKGIDGLLVIQSIVEHDPIDLALDTGASNTTIDLNRILMLGYDLTDALRTVPIETASGVINTHIFKISEMTCLGITRKNIEISTYDFLAYGLFAEFDGVLGLDFLEGYQFCVDLTTDEVSVLKKE
jgi:predicted aspartyl protease